jgi:hypothetical protein
MPKVKTNKPRRQQDGDHHFLTIRELEACAKAHHIGTVLTDPEHVRRLNAFAKRSLGVPT